MRRPYHTPIPNETIMPYNPKDPESGRRSIRLTGYDYTQPGAYFITIVAQNRACLFGEVVDGEMVLSPFGEVVDWCWKRIPDHFENVETDAFVVMPNHAHGVLWILECRGDAFPTADPVYPSVPSDEPDQLEQAYAGNASPLRPGSIGAIVGNFKSITTRRINKMRRTPGAKVWQRNYYERIIRNERELNAIRQYILDNPKNWLEDRER